MWSGLLEANGWQGVVDAGVVSPCPRRFAAPYGAAIRPGQLVLLSAKDSVKAYMRGVDLGCDPASWFSVADASMGEDGAHCARDRTCMHLVKILLCMMS